MNLGHHILYVYAIIAAQLPRQGLALALNALLKRLSITNDEHHMSIWNKVNEEASIVLVGNFNPAIFHPEWFIKHNIVGEWDYGPKLSDSPNDWVFLHDLAQFKFTDGRSLSAILNRFSLQTSRASEYLSLCDITSSTFSVLRQTPIKQLGMNYSSIINIPTEELWFEFGKRIAPHEPWLELASYVDKADTEKMRQVGLWDITFNLPREDDYEGYLRVTIKVVDSVKRLLSFSINSHVNIDTEENEAEFMMNVLNEKWSETLTFAESFVERGMSLQFSKAAQ